MNSSNLSVLVHTFDKYRHLWKGCIDGWQPIIDGETCKFYFGTDLDLIPTEAKGFEMLYSGPGEWSDRLTRLLKQIPTDYVFYAQEDHWPTGYAPIFSEMMRIVSEHGLLRLQISSVNRFYQLEGAEIPLFFDPNSKYLVSHQPSIWKKSFLLECLKPIESPWVNEYKGTLRLQQTGQMREFIRKKIAIFPCDWYKHMCIKGQVVES